MIPVIFSDKALRDMSKLNEEKRKLYHELIKKLSSV